MAAVAQERSVESPTTQAVQGFMTAAANEPYRWAFAHSRCEETS
jgi:hypothetical protein